jgi:PiT family inorganic phosphate transporter
MSVAATTASIEPVTAKPKLDQAMAPRTVFLFLAILAVGLFFTAYSIYQDLANSGTHSATIAPFLLLGVALVIALGFEFVNGFHDTAQ